MCFRLTTCDGSLTNETNVRVRKRKRLSWKFIDLSGWHYTTIKWQTVPKIKYDAVSFSAIVAASTTAVASSTTATATDTMLLILRKRTKHNNWIGIYFFFSSFLIAINWRWKHNHCDYQIGFFLTKTAPWNKTHIW